MNEPRARHRSGVPGIWTAWMLAFLAAGYWTPATRLYRGLLRDMFGKGIHGPILVGIVAIGVLAWEVRRIWRTRTIRKDLLQFVIEDGGHEVARGMLHEVRYDGLSPKNWMRLAFLFFVWGIAAHGTFTRAKTGAAQAFHGIGFLVPSGILLLNWLRAEIAYAQILLPDPHGWLKKVQVPRREWDLIVKWRITVEDLTRTSPPVAGTDPKAPPASAPPGGG